MNEEIMTIQQAAEYMGVNRRTAMNLARAKKLPAKKVGNQWRISRAALRKFLGVPEKAEG